MSPSQTSRSSLRNHTTRHLSENPVDTFLDCREKLSRFETITDLKETRTNNVNYRNIDIIGTSQHLNIFARYYYYPISLMLIILNWQSLLTANRRFWTTAVV
ncbi:uncharacterized protein LOC144469917 [Augochlora pura]